MNHLVPGLSPWLPPTVFQQQPSHWWRTTVTSAAWVNSREMSLGRWIKSKCLCQFSVRTRWDFWVSTKPEAIVSPGSELRTVLNLSSAKIWGGSVNYSCTAAPRTDILSWRRFLTLLLLHAFLMWKKSKGQWLLDIFLNNKRPWGGAQQNLG